MYYFYCIYNKVLLTDKLYLKLLLLWTDTDGHLHTGVHLRPCNPTPDRQTDSVIDDWNRLVSEVSQSRPVPHSTQIWFLC